jgi:hypothetical protein
MDLTAEELANAQITRSPSGDPYRHPMFADPAYRDFVTVLETIDAPGSLFEQYYGLRLAGQMLDQLDPLERRLLRKEGEAGASM